MWVTWAVIENHIYLRTVPIPWSMGKVGYLLQGHPLEKYPLCVISREANTPNPEFSAMEF